MKLISKKKEIKEKSIEELNACKKLEDSFHSSFIEKNQKQKSYILIKKEKNEKNNDNNENNEINKENKQLKDDIKDLEEKIKEAQKEIENMKKLFDKEIKYLQGKK
jgi:molecular chaperone GrpE (heat shock protein)